MFTPCTVKVFIIFVVVPVFAAIILPQILHRALLASSLEKCTHTFDRLFHIFKVLCVCARVSYKYARGEFARARASYEYVPVFIQSMAGVGKFGPRELQSCRVQLQP